MKHLIKHPKIAILFVLAMSVASGAALAMPPTGRTCMIDPMWAFCFELFSFDVCCGLFGI